MDLNQFHASINSHIEKAKKKHKHFADIVDNNPVRACNYPFHARTHKNDIKLYSKAAIFDVLMSEVYEFLAEVDDGNKRKAFQEGCDVIAVIWRALEWMEGAKQ